MHPFSLISDLQRKCLQKGLETNRLVRQIISRAHIELSGLIAQMMLLNAATNNICLFYRITARFALFKIALLRFHCSDFDARLNHLFVCRI